MSTNGGAQKRTETTPEMALKSLRIMGFHCYPLPEGEIVITHPAIPGEIVGKPNSKMVSKAAIAVHRTGKAMMQSALDALEVQS